MATTTNFGWTTPDNTALVKDGALAIRTLGSAIDTSMGDLRGGTSGQILAKNSNTDMDFVWIANDQGDITAVTAGTGISGGGTSGAVTITNSMATAIDAKGDLIVGTGSDTFSRLAVGGTNGHVLTVDSTTATGVAWAAASAGANDWQKIASSTFTAVSNVSIDNCFTSTYANYRVLIRFTSSASNQVYIRFRASGSDNTTSNYSIGWNYRQLGSGGASAGVGANNANYGYLLDTVTGNIAHFVNADIANPQKSTRTQILHNGVWAGYYMHGGGYFDADTVFDGFTIYPTAGTITGSMTVYGYEE